MAVWATLHLGCTLTNLEQINRVSQLTLPECVTPRSDVTYLVSQMSRVTCHEGLLHLDPPIPSWRHLGKQCDYNAHLQAIFDLILPAC